MGQWVMLLRHKGYENIHTHTGILQNTSTATI